MYTRRVYRNGKKTLHICRLFGRWVALKLRDESSDDEPKQFVLTVDVMQSVPGCCLRGKIVRHKTRKRSSCPKWAMLAIRAAIERGAYVRH